MARLWTSGSQDMIPPDELADLFDALTERTALRIGELPGKTAVLDHMTKGESRITVRAPMTRGANETL